MLTILTGLLATLKAEKEASCIQHYKRNESSPIARDEPIIAPLIPIAPPLARGAAAAEKSPEPLQPGNSTG
jgi:hypothetical protein